MKDKIAVMIPCYNEAKTIQTVVNDFKKNLPEATIFVYDNNSCDRTGEIALKAGAIVKKELKQGKGNVVRSMFRDIDADCYVLVDGDDTYPAEKAKEMCRLILENKADMVVGDRVSSTYFKENKRRFHNFGNWIVIYLIKKLFHNEVKDVMSGYRAFSKLFVKTCPVLSSGFEIETEMTIHAIEHNFRIVELPVKYRERPKGSKSKLNTYKDGAKVLKMIVKLFKECKPRVFFGIMSIIFFTIGVVLNVPPFVGYFQTGKVEKFPSLIVGGVFVLMGLLNFVAGIILDVIIQKHNQQYELFINMLAEQMHFNERG